MGIIAPPGMSHELASKLCKDLDFAHMWLCHQADIGEGPCFECPDECFSGVDHERHILYIEIDDEPDSIGSDLERQKVGRALIRLVNTLLWHRNLHAGCLPDTYVVDGKTYALSFEQDDDNRWIVITAWNGCQEVAKLEMKIS